MNPGTFFSAITVAAVALAGLLATKTAPALAGLAAPSPAISTSEAREAPANALPDAAVRRYRTITIPAGTVLPVTLDSYVASDSSHVEDPVRAHVRRAIVIDGETVVPAGSAVSGYVTNAVRSARVKGRAHVAFRFTRLSVPDAERVAIRTSSISRIAPATKREDALKIGIPAAGGAVIGALAGGKKGAAIGAAAGGGGGTAVVLSTRGKEVRLGSGYATSVRLLEPVRVKVLDY